MAIQKISNAVIANDAVSADNIATGAITVADIPDGEITTAKIGDDQITNAKIAPDSVTSTEIANGSVTYNQIADGTIITSKIADSQITSDKLDSDITISGQFQSSVLKATTKRHSAKPALLLDFENSKQVSDLINFNRNSTASYISSDGYIRCHESYENLVTYSSALQNWPGDRLNKFGNTEETLDPKQTNRATKFVQNTTSSTGYITNDYQEGMDHPAGVYNFSIFVKAGSSSWFSFFDSTKGGQILWMNASNGTFGTDSGYVTNKRADDCGNGWWRFSFAYTLDTNSIDWNYYFNCNGDNSSATTVGNYMYAYGVQLTAGEYLRPYRDTASGKFSYLNNYPTRIAQVDEPRVSHDPITLESLGLLLEESRSNYFTFGDALSSGWTNINVSKYVNRAYGPDNMFSAMELVENTSAGQHNIQNQVLSTFQGSGSVWTFSVFAKANSSFTSSGRYFVQRVYGSGNNKAYAVFDLVNGTVANSFGTFLRHVSIEEYRDGWYRCIVTADFDGTNDGWLFGISNNTTGELPSYTGDGSSGVYLWGPQAEIGYFATSYINTFSRGTTVTRSAELATLYNLDYFVNNDKGVSVQVNSKTLTTNPVNYNGHLMSFTTPQEVDGLSSLFTFFYGMSNDDSAGGYIGAAVREDSGYTWVPVADRTVGEFDNFAIRLKENDGAAYLNGEFMESDTSFAVRPNSELHIGRGPADSEYFSGYIKSIRMYNVNLTDSELLELSK